MRIMHRVGPRCDCQAKLANLRLEEEHGDGLEVGSIVECDCGQSYKLIGDQREGEFWQWYDPNSGNMALR